MFVGRADTEGQNRADHQDLDAGPPRGRQLCVCTRRYVRYVCMRGGTGGGIARAGLHGVLCVCMLLAQGAKAPSEGFPLFRAVQPPRPWPATGPRLSSPARGGCPTNAITGTPHYASEPNGRGFGCGSKARCPCMQTVGRWQCGPVGVWSLGRPTRVFRGGAGGRCWQLVCCLLLSKQPSRTDEVDEASSSACCYQAHRLGGHNTQGRQKAAMALLRTSLERQLRHCRPAVQPRPHTVSCDKTKAARAGRSTPALAR